MSWIAEAHSEWHTVHGAHAVCPLDCGASEFDWPTDEQLVNWREADEYRNELDEREDEDNTYDPDDPYGEDYDGNDA